MDGSVRKGLRTERKGLRTEREGMRTEREGKEGVTKKKEILDIYRLVKGLQKKLLTLLINFDNEKTQEKIE